MYVCRTVHVGLETAAEVSVVLYLSYVVQNASWSSSYDARVFTKDKSMKVLTYIRRYLRIYVRTYV